MTNSSTRTHSHAHIHAHVHTYTLAQANTHAHTRTHTRTRTDTLTQTHHHTAITVRCETTTTHFSFLSYFFLLSRPSSFPHTFHTTGRPRAFRPPPPQVRAHISNRRTNKPPLISSTCRPGKITSTNTYWRPGASPKPRSPATMATCGPSPTDST